MLGQWNEEETATLPERVTKAAEACLAFGMQGLAATMNEFNGK